MKNIIKINNEPSFNKGVSTYLTLFSESKEAKGYYNFYLQPNIEYALKFDSDLSREILNMAMYQMKKYHPKAIVETI